jgi:hypothetical protein
MGNNMDGWMIRMEDVREDEILERNKNLNRGFRKLRVWREAIELYVFVKVAFDEFDKRHYGVENKLINLAKSLAKKLKTGQEWNSDYKTE